MTIKPAKIEFNQDGTPVACDFDDVYFSNHNGLLETRYVFLENNHLPQRWLDESAQPFHIAETGFGTGLNFLASWQLFQQTAQPSRHLHFTSTEKFPLDKKDLILALTQWPELAEFSEQLIQQYPDLVDGCHRLTFDKGRVLLDLHFGDVKQIFPTMHNSKDGIVDAWFLDGFAPSKNPQMWNDELYEQLARLSKQGATLATFTAAGIVKRGLAQQGFTIKKVKGFGRKRDMLTGVFDCPDINRHSQSYFQRQSLRKKTSEPIHVGIIGGGIAAANLAISLVQKGLRVTIMCKDAELAKGASGNPQGGFYPQLNAQANITSRVQALAFGFAARRYQQILQAGFSYRHDWCGVLQLAFNDSVLARQNAMIEKSIWPSSLVEAYTTQQCTEHAGIDVPYSGFHIPQGGWICPPDLVTASIAYAQSIGCCEVKLNHYIKSVKSVSTGWQVESFEQSLAFDSVIIATGSELHHVEQSQCLPINLVRGQVEAIPTQAPIDSLKTVLCHKGYMTPALEGRHALGSTYIKEDTSRAYRQEEQATNLQTHQKAMSNASWVHELKTDNMGRAAIRCSLPDHLAVVGALFDPNRQTEQFQHLYKALPQTSYPDAEDLNGLYVFAGLGSRGLTTAPLFAEVLASQLTGEALPMDNQLLSALSPNRFLVKNLIRTQPQK
ncbi:bifunctional tRNA (5-methylaminomethyl-2-thiouridine)(34)-methyltransferase MnmD/FAD-dependent 5-carboxymethylaminomethyl-2-thiouridine(34) oxidoreductase MnmC [Aliiglaciecola sp.]|nr:bifunctional tRNA (5-methylaminomethyl-2-thiouridine)(34)-methyltransferase MnmD/FAD-dependent 5-carboxymethylaminomethyl-2-thiouridine(34) oxidoreductase MnmC [Aliiglaciecola sp.]